MKNTNSVPKSTLSSPITTLVVVLCGFCFLILCLEPVSPFPYNYMEVIAIFALCVWQLKEIRIYTLSPDSSKLFSNCNGILVVGLSVWNTIFLIGLISGH